MDGFYSVLAPHLGLVNAALVLIIFLVVRQRYIAFDEDITANRNKIERLEKTLLLYGFKIYEGD